MTNDPNALSRAVPATGSRSRWADRIVLLLLAALCSCGSFEDKRIRELLHEKGFGSRANGDATRENYIGGQDVVQFLVPPDVLLLPGHERLAELTVAQPIGIDGTIFVPYVGPVYALGKTESEIAALVRTQLRSALVSDVNLQARILGSNKVFYAIGETGAKGPVPLSTDMTLIDAIFRARYTPLANLGRVYLIRPDAEHPLVVDVNVREMLVTGLTTANLQIRERDILYIPPTFLGLVARLFERLLQPVRLAVGTLLGAAQIQFAYDVLTGTTQARFFRF